MDGMLQGDTLGESRAFGNSALMVPALTRDSPLLSASVSSSSAARVRVLLEDERARGASFSLSSSAVRHCVEISNEGVGLVGTELSDEVVDRFGIVCFTSGLETDSSSSLSWIVSRALRLVDIAYDVGGREKVCSAESKCDVGVIEVYIKVGA